MKVKKEIQPAIFEEIEIQFPLFRKLGNCNYYHVVSENKVICVSDYFDNNYSITIDNYICQGNVFSSKSIEITESEFITKFNEILTKIKNN